MTEQNFIKMFELFDNTKKFDSFEKLIELFKPTVFQKYLVLLDSIKKFQIDLDLNWASHKKEDILSTGIRANESFTIIDKITKLENEFKDEIKLLGQFRALDFLENRFKFEDHQGEIFKGSFIKEISNLEILDFTNPFTIKLERRTIFNPTKNGEDFRYTLVNFDKSI